MPRTRSASIVERRSAASDSLSIPLARAARRVGAQGRAALSLVRVSGAAARGNGTSRVWAARRARQVRRHGGFEYQEALTTGLIDPALSPEDCATYVSRHVNMEAQLRLNGSDEPDILNQKIVFQRYCEGVGVRVPRLIGVVDRLGGSWMLPDGGVLPIEAGGVDLLPSSFIVKPSAGYEGFGVQPLHRTEGGGLAQHDGRPTTLPELVFELRSHPDFDTWLVQERIRNHPDVVAIAGGETVHTIRFITLVGRDGRAELLWVGMRLGIGDAAVNNFRGGTLGNLSCSVDPETGVLFDACRIRDDGLGLTPSPTIPGTSIQVNGVRLPHWDAAREMVLRASPEFLPVRTIGWDIALSPDGPVALEANTRWGAPGIPGMRAVVARLEDALPR